MAKPKKKKKSVSRKRKIKLRTPQESLVHEEIIARHVGKYDQLMESRNKK